MTKSSRLRIPLSERCCPFCVGNEDETPPTLLEVPGDDGLEVEHADARRDIDPSRRLGQLAEGLTVEAAPDDLA